jgi:3-oxoacyl-[acyl-carrier-protein] synthase II
VLAGSVEECPPLLHAALDRFGALAVPRPFDRRRRGFLLAEGATLVLLESAETACARNARVLTRLLGWGSAFDPSASTIGWGSGVETLARELAALIARCGIDPADVDLVVSGASGSIAGDRLEARTLRRVWGDRPLPPVVAPKGVTGEYGGAFLAAAIAAAEGSPPAVTAGFSEPDPELGIVPHEGALPAIPRVVLVSSLASGGGASWVLLQNPGQ